jgi:hypothetical protein
MAYTSTSANGSVGASPETGSDTLRARGRSSIASVMFTIGRVAPAFGTIMLTRVVIV